MGGYRPKGFAKAASGVVALGALWLATGCADFFPPLNSSGTSSASNTGDYVYVLNPTQSTLTSYVVGTDSLATVGSTFTFSGVIPEAITVSRANTFVYVATTGGIYGYSIGSTGALTALAGGAALVAAEDVSLDTSPDGQWLVGLNLLTYSIDEYAITSTGTISVEGSTTYSAPTGLTVQPTKIKVSPTGNYVAAALGNAGLIVYPFTTSNGTFGSLQQIKFTITTLSDNGVAIDPTGTYLYVSQSGSNNGTAENGVYSYNLANLASGSNTSPLAALVSSGNSPGPIALNKAGTYLYVGNRSDNTISGYSVSSAGTLTQLSGSPYAGSVSVTPHTFAVDNTGNYFLEGTAGNSTDLSLYSYDASTLGKLDSQAQISTGTDNLGALIATTH